MNWQCRISTKITLLGFGLVTMTVLALMVILTLQMRRLAPVLTRELNRQAYAEACQLAKTLRDGCATLQAENTRNLEHSLQAARQLIQKEGGVLPHPEHVTWEVENQVSHQKTTAELPKLMLGTNWLGQNLSAATPSLVVDEVRRFTGAETTIFQRMNAAGDMLRVCTSVIKSGGRRAVGTCVPAANPDGTPNPVVATVLKGETFRGRALVVDAWFNAVYEPLWDAAHRQVIGMLFVGVNMTETTRAARQTVLKASLGKTGYGFVLGTKGESRGRYIVSSKGAQDGKDIWDTTDASGNHVVQNIIQKALAATDGRTETIEYPWLNPGDRAPRPKFAAVNYFEPWDWVIGASAYADEYQQAQAAVLGNLAQMFWRMMAAAGLISLFALAVSYVLSRSINRPIQRISDALVAGAVQTAAAADHVSAASQSLAEGANEQAAAIEQTSASLEELSSMTQRNSGNSNKTSELSKQALEAAERGVANMHAMSSAMSGIQSSSDDIANIIKTIDEIAFQTNILALNAAVEAARAGAAGAGFAVVADEVRNLALRCARAAKETEAKIEGAIGRTGQGAEISAKVSQALGEIVTRVRQVDELASAVAGASNEQSQGISQINISVGQMDKVTQSNAAAAEQSAASAEQLNAQAEATKHSVNQLMALVGGKILAERARPKGAGARPAGHSTSVPRLAHFRRSDVQVPELKCQ